MSEVPVGQAGILINALSASGTIGGPIDLGGTCRNVGVYIVFSTGTTAGTVVTEESPINPFAGTWANIATSAWSAANAITKVNFVGVVRWIQCRISVAIAGGTVNVYLWAN